VIGFVATFDLGEGEPLSVTRSGAVRSTMLREAIDDVLAHWPDAKLVCYSTPETILNDLQGRIWAAGDRPLQYPEKQALGRVRRLEALHPRLVSETSRAERMRGRRRRARAILDRAES
jgi:hypothetical protein